jgi:hypothetical protein
MLHYMLGSRSLYAPLQTRYENDLELSGRTIYGRVGRKKEMRSCLSNLDPLQNTPTLAKLHPKMITASTLRASVSRVRAAKKTLAHDHRHLSSNSAKIFAIPLYVYKKYRCVPPLSQTPQRRDLRSRRQIKQTTIDRSSSTIIFNFFLVAPSPYLAGLGTTPGKFRARTLSGKPLRKRNDLNFKWPVAHLGATPGSSAEGVRDIIQADSVYG